MAKNPLRKPSGAMYKTNQDQLKRGVKAGYVAETNNGIISGEQAAKDNAAAKRDSSVTPQKRKRLIAKGK